MASVYVSNLVINAGSDFSQSFDLETAAQNSALNLTNYTVSAQMRKWHGSSSSTAFTCTIQNPATSGKIYITLTSQQTTNLTPGRYVYDIIITNNSGAKTRVVEGMVLVREGVTR